MWIGFIFVFSAALAREYDAEYIPHRPWIMLVPLAASLFSSFILWLLLWLAAIIADGKTPPFWKNYRAFLGLFWLTAPLAWLYAIPVERFLDPVAAVKANYLLLGIVATWRVVLMIRVAQVFTGRNIVSAILLVLCFGNAALLTALNFSPWPVIEIMSGARHDEIHRAHVNVVQGTFCMAVLAVPALFVMLLLYLPFGVTAKKRRTRKSLFPALRMQADTPARRSLWVLAGVSILVWLPLLPFTQPPLIGKKTEWDLAQDDRQAQRRYWQDISTGNNVLSRGESVRLFSNDSSLLINADATLERTYTWGDTTLRLRLKTDQMIDGAYVLSYSETDPAVGITHVSVAESTRQFKTQEEALAWLKARPMKLRWTSDGFAGAWKFEDGRLEVELWQVRVGNSEPMAFPEASDGWFKLSR